MMNVKTLAAFNSSFRIPHSSFSFKLEPCGNAPIKFSDCFIDDQHKSARHKNPGVKGKGEGVKMRPLALDPLPFTLLLFEQLFPLCVDRARAGLVHALVGVRAEEVALRLREIER